MLSACGKEEPKPIDKTNLLGEIKATRVKIKTAKGADTIDLRLRLKEAKELYVIDKGKAYIYLKTSKTLIVLNLKTYL